jgi:hypothetical protein
LHWPSALGAAEVTVPDGEGELLALGEADVGDAEDEVGGALLLPAGLGLGPQAARSSSEAAAVVITSPILMR